MKNLKKYGRVALEWAGVAGLAMLAATCALGLLLLTVVLVVGFSVGVPSMIGGGVLWFIWTYLGLGATYFAQLDPQWLNIPYWHVVGGYAVALVLVRLLLRRPPLGDMSKGIKKAKEKTDAFSFNKA